MAFGNILGFMWFGLLFIAGITSSISLAQPAVAFLEDEFNLSRKKATLILAIAGFILCQPVIFLLGKGSVDEMDFWGGTFCLVLFATIETILFAWVFGMDRAWTQLHVGSDITIPRIYRFIIKYVTPAFLLCILGFWLKQEWISTILLRNVPPENFWFIVGIRLMLLAFFILLVFLVYKVWKRRSAGEKAGETSPKGGKE
jgi:SNF family Na+-dependent transporter